MEKYIGTIVIDGFVLPYAKEYEEAARYIMNRLNVLHDIIGSCPTVGDLLCGALTNNNIAELIRSKSVMLDLMKEELNKPLSKGTLK